MNERKKVLWTSPRSQTTTKSLINPLYHQTYLKTWVFRGNPNAAFKNCWRASQEGEKLGSLLNPNFLLSYLNPLPVLLSRLHPPGSNKLTLRGEGNQRAKRRWNLGDLVLPLKKNHTGQPSNRKPARPPAEDQKGAMFRCLSPEHDSQPQCSEVSP